MTTIRRTTKPTDPVEILLAEKVPAFSREAHSAAIGLYYFNDRGELPASTQEHLRRVLERWRPEVAVAGWEQRAK
jgi:hypothetical protein